MGVYIYGNNAYPSGGPCIRVARCVGGKPRQRYFALQPGALKSAEALDALWGAEQKAAALARKRAAKPTARASDDATVRGIRFMVRTERKTNRDGRTRNYHVPLFEVSVSEDEERPSPKRFRIAKLRYERAWTEAVKWLAEHKGIEDYSGLIARMPPMSKTLGAWRSSEYDARASV